MSAAPALSDAESGDRRRSGARHPIAADVAYQLKRGRNLGAGRGRSVNMSSSGILLATETPVLLMLRFFAPRGSESAPRGSHCQGHRQPHRGSHRTVRIPHAGMESAPASRLPDSLEATLN